jgi:hypothetical protein
LGDAVALEGCLMRFDHVESLGGPPLSLFRPGAPA